MPCVWPTSTPTPHNHPHQEAGPSLLARFVASMARRGALHSIWHHFHKASRHDNAIFGRDDSTWERAHGSPEPPVEVLDLGLASPPQLRFPPNVFRQANTDGFTRIIRSLRKFVKTGSTCIELYGGVGTIGLNLLDRVSTLSCSDANPFNEACFNATRDAMPPELGSKAVVSCVSCAG